jgi:hypothetical protein
MNAPEADKRRQLLMKTGIRKKPSSRQLFCRTTFFTLIAAMHGCTSVDNKRLPEPQTLVERHIEAAYGEDGLSGKRAISLGGKLVIESFDVDAPVTMKTEAPDKRLFKTEVMGEEVVRTCKGGECWAREYDAAPEPLRGGALDFMTEVADFNRLENLDRYYRHLETTGIKEFNGQQAYEVTLVRDNGNRDKWYFDKDSGLWLGGTWRLPREMGGIQVTQYFEDYQEFNGNKVATQITEITPGQTSKVIIEDVSYGDIPDREFEIQKR